MNRIKCIIVDDEDPVRKRLEKLLSCFSDIEIMLSTSDTKKAITAISQINPDLVFLDVEMPGCNGFDIIREVNGKSYPPTYIFVTAFNQYAIKAIKNEAFDFILKPVSIDELSETLERYRIKNSDLNTKVQNNPCFDILSNREKEVLQELHKGHTSKTIAENLYISKNTVDTHRRAILKKLNVSSTVELISKH